MVHSQVDGRTSIIGCESDCNADASWSGDRRRIDQACISGWQHKQGVAIVASRTPGLLGG